MLCPSKLLSMASVRGIHHARTQEEQARDLQRLAVQQPRPVLSVGELPGPTVCSTACPPTASVCSSKGNPMVVQRVEQFLHKHCLGLGVRLLLFGQGSCCLPSGGTYERSEGNETGASCLHKSGLQIRRGWYSGSLAAAASQGWAAAAAARPLWVEA